MAAQVPLPRSAPVRSGLQARRTVLLARAARPRFASARPRSVSMARPSSLEAARRRFRRLERRRRPSARTSRDWAARWRANASPRPSPPSASRTRSTAGRPPRRLAPKILGQRRRFWKLQEEGGDLGEREIVALQRLGDDRQTALLRRRVDGKAVAGPETRFSAAAGRAPSLRVRPAS